MTEPMFQISEKASDTAILVIRGNNYQEFVSNVAAFMNDPTSKQILDSFVDMMTTRPASMQQAVNTVMTQMPGTQVVQQPKIQPQAQMPQQTPPQQTTNNTFACPHGAMNYREGQAKNGSKWAGYFCPARADTCRPVSPDGTPWK